VPFKIEHLKVTHGVRALGHQRNFAWFKIKDLALAPCDIRHHRAAEGSERGGRYPNGMRVHADGEWGAIVRNRPLDKRELASLKEYFDADGSPNFRDGGPETNDRLQIRGLVEISYQPTEGREPYYRITAAGKVEWQRLSTKSD